MRYKGNINLQPGESGDIQLIVDNIDDIWALYNIIEVGDNITLSTFRKVQHETGSKSSSTKKKIFITINIEEIDYSNNSIRIKGKNTTKSEYIEIGQYHTDEIGINSSFTLSKKYWDEFHIETLKNVTDITVISEIAAILMDTKISHLFYITNTSTITKGEISQSIPKKRIDSTKHDKGLNKFFEKILNQFIKQINFEHTKVLIIASPGNIKDEFKKYIQEQLENKAKEWSELKNNLNKIIYTHSSSGFKHSLVEILAKPEINKLIKDTKGVNDIIALEKFNEILGTQVNKIFFGFKSFEIAFEKDAIDTLIVTDGYLRKMEPLTRKDLCTKIRELKLVSKVYQFSSKHITGEKIDEYGGICGILKYFVEEIAELGNENKKEDKKEDKKDDKKDNKKELKGNNKKNKKTEINKINLQPKINNKEKKNIMEEDDDDYENYYDEYYEYDEYDESDKYYNYNG